MTLFIATTGYLGCSKKNPDCYRQTVNAQLPVFFVF
jgi:hypothetical protein